jgi:hypothetical protein
MPTIDRMLAVLNRGREALQAMPAATLLSAQLSQRNSRAGRSVAAASRGRGHRGPSLESLEQRQMLAVSTFATAAAGGLVTIVGSPGDNIFVQQVASAPQAFYIADNSSFQGRTVVGGPSTTLGPGANPPGAVSEQFLPGINFNTLDRIIITSGEERVETVPQNAQGYPMIAANITRFMLSGSGANVFNNDDRPDYLRGTFSLVQSDGSPQTWTFDNFGGGNPVLTSGVGVSSPAVPGQIYPLEITAVDTDVSGSSSRKSGIVIRWSEPQLPRVPVLDRVDWFRDTEFEVGGQTDQNLLPAAPQTAFISLPNAMGPGLDPIIPSSVLAEIVVDGQLIEVSSTADGTLFFDGQQTGRFSREVGFFSPNTVFEGTITGRVVTGNAQDPVTKEFRRGLEFTLSGPYTLSLASARYAVGASGAPVSATVFAGHDITAGLDINLRSPGSSINIDSPVAVQSTRNYQGISLRATSVDVNAPVTVNSVTTKTKVDGVFDITKAGRLEVGPAIIESQAGFETARAVAEIVSSGPNAGSLSKIVIPEGLGGAGYDAANPPSVTIDAPQSLQATVSVTGIVNGVVSAVTIDAPGTGYTSPPTVTFVGAATQVASAVAVVGGTQGVLSINIVNGGRGYRQAPQVLLEGGAGNGARATARIVGSLDTSTVFVTNGGFGYSPNTTLPLTITGSGTGASGTAQVGPNGAVTSVTITNGGSGYSPATTSITIPAPPPSSGTPASATAVVDPATTRVVAITIDNPGTGYGRIPGVSIAPPVALAAAGRLRATVANGEVTAITFTSGTGLRLTVQTVDSRGGVLAAFAGVGNGGSGYAVGDTVTIDSTGSRAGRSAQFRVLQVSGTGAVQRVGIFGSGSSYTAGELLAHNGVPFSGRGYTAQPKVFISRPDDPLGTQATAEAEINAIGAVTRITITDRGSGYTTAPTAQIAGLSAGAVAESLRFNAASKAGVFDISLADDPYTATDRSLMLVSRTGSLQADVRTSPAATDNLVATSVRAEVRQGDVRVEGLVNATAQSYLMQSSPRDVALAPFVLSTDSIGSGVAVGRIAGNTVAVTLANDLPTPLASAVAFNVVTLNTSIDSLRVRAARTTGAPITDPFPYTISLSEETDLAIDALAASSFPIAMQAGGSMKFNAALTTAGGFALTSGGTLTIEAPVSTTFGQINLAGQALQVNSSLRVTDEPVDEVRPDIVLDASGGEVRVRGGVIQAPGRVVINQKTGRVPKTNSYSASLQSTAIVGGQTVSLPISVTDNFTYNGLGISIDVAMTDPAANLSDLSAVLVGPNGARYSLFGRFDAQGKTFTKTLFSPEATTSIRASDSKEPYTGSFLPRDAAFIRSTYNRDSAFGTWRVEVSASRLSTAPIGSIAAASLSLRDPIGDTAGDVYGTSLIKATALKIDAEGAVGDARLQPSQSEFYLNTDVDVVDATAGKSFSLSDATDVNIESLRAKGLVSLRANGVDRQDGSAALRGVLTDIPAIDVNALAGSIDLQVFTAKTLEVGNTTLLSLAAPFRTGLASMRAAGNVSLRTVGGSQGGDIVVRDAPLAGSSARQVRAALTNVLQGTYASGTPGTFPSQITASANGALSTLLPGLSSALAVGDRILVAGGVVNGTTNLAANGIYTVRQLGGPTSRWQLVRAADADTLAELPSRTFVTPLEGANADRTYQVFHTITATARFGADTISINQVSLQTNLRSGDPNDSVSFVVSTTDGTNASPGSLGKMLRLRQQNAFSASANPARSPFLFAATITSPILLTQELPIIDRAFAIDGRLRFPQTASAQPISIDGARIVTTRGNRPVQPTTTVDGFVFTAGAQGGSIANVIVGGFARGAAIRIAGANAMAVNGVQLGVDAQGNRLANRVSLQVSSANNTTVTNGVIAGAADAGLLIEGSANGTVVAGTKIGTAAAANTVGVRVTSTGNNNRIGQVAPGVSRTIISNNGTGVVLAAGTVTMLNTDVVSNGSDGIQITGGNHVIGTSTTLAVTSNEISGNSRWGINVITPGVIGNQSIRGNYFGRLRANTLGNVAVNSAATTLAAYIPNPSSGIDPNGNQHVVTTTTPTLPGAPPTKPPLKPWRPR